VVLRPGIHPTFLDWRYQASLRVAQGNGRGVAEMNPVKILAFVFLVKGRSWTADASLWEPRSQSCLWHTDSSFQAPTVPPPPISWIAEVCRKEHVERGAILNLLKEAAGGTENQRHVLARFLLELFSDASHCELKVSSRSHRDFLREGQLGQNERQAHKQKRSSGLLS